MIVLIGACQATSISGQEDVRLLTNEELTELFSDTVITDSERSTLKEVFYADGRYESRSRVQYKGTYFIANDGHAYTSTHAESWWLKTWHTACGVALPPARAAQPGTLTCDACRSKMQEYVQKVAARVGVTIAIALTKRPAPALVLDEEP